MSRYETVLAVLDEEMAKPYVYGESDCFFLGCRLADALDEKLELVRKYWRAYRTLAGAQRALRKRGFTSLVGFFESHLTKLDAPALAQLGDLVILHLGDGEHVGVCLGTRFITKTDKGASYHSLGDCIAAFRIG